MSDTIAKTRTLPQKNTRQSNLELLRILATLFVVIVHYNNTGSGKAFLYADDMPLHYEILLIFEMLAICAVNIFVMISGYFLCTSTHVKISKIALLYIDVIAISVLRYSLYCLMGETTFDPTAFLYRFIPLNWYVAVYTGLYLLSPYLNQIIKDKNISQFRFMLLIFFFVLSVWPSGVEFLSKALDFSPDSLSPISNQGSSDGYTLVNFILLYLLGAYFRLYSNKAPSTRKIIYALFVYLGCTILNTIYANFFFGRAASYCNPLVIIQTVAIFVIFQNLSIRSKAINSIASCSFGVYLMHSFFFRFCQIERFVTGNPLLIPVHIILSALLIYAASALIYRVYKKLFNPVFNIVEKKLCSLGYDVA